MGLISPGGENLLDFLELGRASRVTTGNTGTRSGGLRKGQSPCEFSVASLDSSPVLKWILGNFWTLPSGVSPRLEWGHARELSSRTVAAVSVLVSSGGIQVRFTLEL